MKNKLTKTEYIVWMAVFLATAIVWTYTMLPWPWSFPKWSVYAALGISAVIGVLAGCKCNRNFATVAVSLLVPVEICVAALFARHLPWLFLAVAVAAVIVGGLAGFRLGRGLLAPDCVLRHLKGYVIGAALQRGLRVAVLVAAILPGAISVGLVARIPLYQGQTESIQGAWAVDDTDGDLAAAIVTLQQWDDLSLQERLDVLGRIRNVEVFHTGIDHPVELTADYLDSGIAGQYDAAHQRVTMDAVFLERATAKQAVLVLLHECYHAVQYLQADLYQEDPQLYQAAASVAIGLDCYIAFADDPQAYEAQQIEQAADDYAQRTYHKYFP